MSVLKFLSGWGIIVKVRWKTIKLHSLTTSRRSPPNSSVKGYEQLAGLEVGVVKTASPRSAHQPVPQISSQIRKGRNFDGLSSQPTVENLHCWKWRHLLPDRVGDLCAHAACRGDRGEHRSTFGA